MRSKLICVTYGTRDFFNMLPGAERRKAIIDHILQSGSLVVNRRYCLQIHEDRDLQVLIKKGTLKQERWGGSHAPKRTYLVLA